MTPEQAFGHAHAFAMKWEALEGCRMEGLESLARRLSPEKLRAMYRASCWDGLLLDTVAKSRPFTAIAMYDTAVAMGGLRAVRFLQEAAGAGVRDGLFGQETRLAMHLRGDRALALGILAARVRWLEVLARNDPDRAARARAWQKRAEALRGLIMKLSRQEM